MLLLGGSGWQSADAMIKVDAGTPAAANAEELARGFAQEVGGAVSPERLDFDGTPGVSVVTSSQTMATPRYLIAIFHGGKAYLLMAAATGDRDLAADIARIRETWKWAQ